MYEMNNTIPGAYFPGMNPLQMQQPWSRPQPQQMPVPQQQNQLIRVTGIDGARAYQMPPNSVAPLFDSDNDILFVKSTDGAGFPTIRAFRFEAIDMERQQAGQAAEYVTRKEFEELKGMIMNGKQFVPSRTGTDDESHERWTSKAE